MAQAPPFSAFDASVHGGCGGWKCRLATEAIAGGLGESAEPARIDAGYGAYHPQIASDQVGCLPRKELTEPDAGVRIYSNPDETWPNEFPTVLWCWRPALPWQISFGDRARPIPLLPPDSAAYLSTIGEPRLTGFPGHWVRHAPVGSRPLRNDPGDPALFGPVARAHPVVRSVGLHAGSRAPQCVSLKRQKAIGSPISTEIWRLSYLQGVALRRCSRAIRFKVYR